MFKTEAITKFLKSNTHADLANLYNPNMEVQVNVAQDGGKRVEGDFKGKQWHGYSDGVLTWKTFRIPFKANTEPEYEDSFIGFDISAHAEGIGMTGWDWKERCSRWVGFDFDAITGHKHSKKLTEMELSEVEEKVRNIPWVTVRRSTSGKGLHLYVFVNCIPTRNHTEHAALGRAILSMLTGLTGYDFSAKVDACGANLWVWHRKMIGTNGLELIKKGAELQNIPDNWKDHIDVASGKRKRTAPSFIIDPDEFQEFTGKRPRISLDSDHLKLINFLQGSYHWWCSEHWMLICHTHDLERAHKELKLRGLFKTISTGSSDANSFAFPMRRGGWSVRRYTQGTPEAETWSQDGKNWTFCLFNVEPDLKTVARFFGGVEQEKGGFVFDTSNQAVNVVKIFGQNLDIPVNRKTLIKQHKDGRLIIQIDRETQDNRIEGWITDKKGEIWTRVLDARVRDSNEIETNSYDDLIRHIVTMGGDDSGWCIRSDGTWRNEPLTHVKSVLAAMNHTPREINNIIGSNILKAWTLVNKPFEIEYPADRQWNKSAVQFRFQPTKDLDNLSFPSWLKVLNHCGRGLDSVIQNHDWCKNNAILSGGDYLKCWIASLFQFPLEPLPYLFFYGPELSGKSIFHEALKLLVTHGIVKAADTLLSDYNGELANCIVAVIEELDLGTNKKALNRIKDYVTAREIAIRPLFEQTYMVPNSLHFVQSSNHAKYCPILQGDTRITVCPVLEGPTEPIPKKDLFNKLEKEAPDFLAEILNLEIPVASDPRLNLPVIMTYEKNFVAQSNLNLLELFLNENCHYVPGSLIKLSEFHEQFITWLDPSERGSWGKRKLGEFLPSKFVKGRIASGDWYISNVSFQKPENGHVNKPYILVDNKLVQQ